MIKFKTIDGVRKVVNELNTPTKKDFPKLTRQQRRRMVYGNSPNNPNRILDRVIRLRNKMIESGIDVPKMPEKRNKKILSGYMGELVKLVNGKDALVGGGW